MNELIEDVDIVKDISIYYYKNSKQQQNILAEKRRLIKRMKKAMSYEEWKEYASHYDQLKGIN